MMPGMDGISVLRILKGDPETRLMPVVLMTALNAVEDRVRGIEAGADDFLSKPVDDRELLARINTALAFKRAIDDRSTSCGARASIWSGTAAVARRGGARARLASARRELPGRGGGLHRPPAQDGRRAAHRCARRDVERGRGEPLVAVFDGPDARARASRPSRRRARSWTRTRRTTPRPSGHERRDQRRPRGGRLDAGDDRRRATLGVRGGRRAGRPCVAPPRSRRRWARCWSPTTPRRSSATGSPRTRRRPRLSPPGRHGEDPEDDGAASTTRPPRADDPDDRRRRLDEDGRAPRRPRVGRGRRRARARDACGDHALRRRGARHDGGRLPRRVRDAARAIRCALALLDRLTARLDDPRRHPHRRGRGRRRQGARHRVAHRQPDRHAESGRDPRERRRASSPPVRG